MEPMDIKKPLGENEPAWPEGQAVVVSWPCYWATPYLDMRIREMRRIKTEREWDDHGPDWSAWQ